MGKGKRIEAEIQLPEAIFQHIQSFLSGKEAAKTTILSKSWYNAWLTRPHLYFDERHFRSNCFVREGESRFWEFVRKTVQRYEKLNLRIESLRLWIYGASYNLQHYSNFRGRELIINAMKMGAIYLYFDILAHKRFVLPHEVLANEHLNELSVSGCKIDGKLGCSRLESLTLSNLHLDSDIIGGLLGCSRLKSLSLSNVHLEGDLSGCCSRLKSLSLSYMRLEHDIIGDIFLSSPMIEELSLSVYPFLLKSFSSSYNVSKLKFLLLYNLDVDTLFFHDLSSKFPCLKDLGVHDCDGYKGIRISSHSLESISFTRHKKMLRAKFDVPSIRKFTFSGSHSPSLSFTTSRSNWETDISISFKRHHSATWFLGLNNLLTKLSPSRVSLSLIFDSGMSFSYLEKVQGLPKPVVDNLKIQLPSSECPALFDLLFWFCRPVFITQYWTSELILGEKRNSDDVLGVVYRRLMQRVDLNCCIANQCKSGQCDLEDVVLEFFYEDVSAWRPLPLKPLLDALRSPAAEFTWKSLLDASTSPFAEFPWKLLLLALTSPFDEWRIRFHLIWGRDIRMT